MNINIQYFAAIREAVGKSSEQYTTEVQSLEELYKELKATYDLPYCISQIRFSLNEEFADKQCAFNEGDHVVLIPPVAGG